ncbi:SsgA family sporulation/cell division regulator [Streptantibioticus ferralitis]|uniref:SsgA family sporulation/cell division regulator n=1 Tax=Streptantibioticus ferralitis TaxID=236510 RepID=A0ABT5Z4X8_9ACTN|nr:SsgA family sporulation/cell division regulator [Streptantibioticus ferralitis]MDF2258854.1 SsgA family sporulation/cell division regulator [Streptantibioticus ferralitis]
MSTRPRVDASSPPVASPDTPRPVEKLFARDPLAAGLATPVGLGDVQAWPAPRRPRAGRRPRRRPHPNRLPRSGSHTGGAGLHPAGLPRRDLHGGRHRDRERPAAAGRRHRPPAARRRAAGRIGPPLLPST